MRVHAAPCPPHDVERLPGPVDGMALPLGQVDLVDSASHHDAHVAVVFRKVVGRSVAGFPFDAVLVLVDQ